MAQGALMLLLHVIYMQRLSDAKLILKVIIVIGTRLIKFVQLQKIVQIYQQH